MQDLIGDTLSSIVSASVGAVAVLLWNSYRRRFARALDRTSYEYRNREMLGEHNSAVIDHAVPEFLVDDLSIRDKGQVFKIAMPTESLKRYNTSHKIDRETQGVVGQIFGSSDLSYLAEITEIPDIVDRIERARMRVAQWFEEKTNGCLFNGIKFGAYRYNFDAVEKGEQRRMSIEVFETDYFTDRVMTEVHRQLLEENPDHPAGQVERAESLNSHYFPFFCGIGINAFVLTDNQERIVFSERSRNVEASNASEADISMHVSMNEAVSQSDISLSPIEDRKILLNRAFHRGIWEELGLPQGDPRMGQPHFHSAIVVKNTAQLGLVCWATFNGTFSELNDLRGKDKFLESNQLVSVAFESAAISKFLKSQKFIPYSRYALWLMTQAWSEVSERRVRVISTAKINWPFIKLFIQHFSRNVPTVVYPVQK